MQNKHQVANRMVIDMDMCVAGNYENGQLITKNVT